MPQYLLNRLLQSLPTLLGVCILTFSIVRLVPGDPVMLLLGERGGSPEAYQELQAALGLDRSLPEQFLSYVGNILVGDFGQSMVSKQPVLHEFAVRFAATMELSLLALFFAVLVGVPLGVFAGLFRGSAVDTAITSTALTGYSMPIFWWGLLLILLFSVELGWTPVSGRMSLFFDIEPITGFYLIDSWFSEEPWPTFKSVAHHLVLPAFVLATVPLASIMRMTRGSMLEVLGQDYVRTAKAKGLSFYSVVFVHALRNALIPVVTVIGLMFGALLTGAVLTETIFSWPGVGRWLVQSVQARDYSVIQSGVLMLAIIVIILNIVVDLAYFAINPQMKSELLHGKNNG